MNKVVEIDQVIANVQDGASIFLGGFLGVGSPLKCIEKLAASGKRDLTIISEVSGMPGGGFDMAILFKNRQVKKVITSHIGTYPLRYPTICPQEYRLLCNRKTDV